jgi:hypothetical protein
MNSEPQQQLGIHQSQILYIALTVKKRIGANQCQTYGIWHDRLAPYP